MNASMWQRAADARHATDPDVLWELAQDSSEFVRSRVCLNPATPHNVLLEMCERGDHPDVLMHLATRIEDLDALIKLTEHDNKHVRQFASQNLHIPFGVWIQNRHLRRIP